MAALRPDWIFERFVVTEATRSAFEQVVAFASESARAPRLLLLWGPTGVGKSHLLQSILRSALARGTTAPVAYTTAAEFIQDIIEAIRRGPKAVTSSMPVPAGLVAVDDLHVLRDRPAAQKEVAASFKAGLDAGGRVVCAAGCRPTDIPVLVSVLRVLPEARLVELPKVPATGMRRVVASLATSSALDLTASVRASIAADCRGDVRRAVGAIARRRFEREASGH